MKINEFLKITPEAAEFFVTVPNSNDTQTPPECKFYVGDKDDIECEYDCGKYEIEEIAVAPKFFIDCKPYPFPEEDENSEAVVSVDSKTYDQLEALAEAEGLATDEYIFSILKNWIEKCGGN